MKTSNGTVYSMKQLLQPKLDEVLVEMRTFLDWYRETMQ